MTLENNPSNRAGVLRRRAEKLLEMAEAIENRPSEPTGDDDGCAVVWWQMQFRGEGRTYTYAATRAGDRLWHVTGSSTPQRVTWDALLDWIYGNAGSDDIVIWEATAWDTV